MAYLPTSHKPDEPVLTTTPVPQRREEALVIRPRLVRGLVAHGLSRSLGLPRQRQFPGVTNTGNSDWAREHWNGGVLHFFWADNGIRRGSG
jgi:hypothetical protein